MIAARGNGKSALSARLMEAVIRADVHQYFDWKTNELHLVSCNLDAPLTDKEKEAIRFSFSIRMIPYGVVFDN